MQTLAERIRELREKKDLSLRELAREVGVSAAFLSDVELGRRYPSEEVLVKIAKALRASFEELQALDNRPDLDELRRRATLDPQFALALRRLVDKNLSPDDILSLVNRNRRGDDQKKHK